MSESRSEIHGDPLPGRQRYRLLLEVTDVVARAQSLPDALKELAQYHAETALAQSSGHFAHRELVLV